MKKLSLVFMTLNFLFLGCDINQSNSESSKNTGSAVKLSESKGCGNQKSDDQTDEVSFAQSSKKIDSSSDSADELNLDEKKTDSGCSL
jgi:hypothetical protein